MASISLSRLYFDLVGGWWDAAVLGQLLCPFAHRPFQMTSPEWTQLERHSSCITHRAGQQAHLFSIYNPDLHPPTHHPAALFPRRGLRVGGSSIHHKPERSLLSDSSISALHLSGEERTGPLLAVWPETERSRGANNKNFTMETCWWTLFLSFFFFFLFICINLFTLFTVFEELPRLCYDKVPMPKRRTPYPHTVMHLHFYGVKYKSISIKIYWKHKYLSWLTANAWLMRKMYTCFVPNVVEIF